MAQAARKRAKITVETFLDMRFDDDFHYELIDGEIVAQASASPAHSSIQFALGQRIAAALDRKNSRDGTRCRA
jgi:Uma2 family endonuclease